MNTIARAPHTRTMPRRLTMIVLSALAAAILGAAGPSGPGATGPGGVQTFNGVPRPPVPNVQVVPLLDGGFRVTWDNASTSETRFVVQRKPKLRPVANVSMPADSTEYVDREALATAQYRVRAMGVQGRHSAWSPWRNATSALVGFPVLTPGSGFSGPTPQPALVGTSLTPGFDAKAIARWDVVPYQTFDSTFHVGVVAFHMNGIDRVEFSANGGPWVAVREMKLNPRSGVWEYTALLKAGDFADGPVEVRAIAYPKLAGMPRVLESMELFANSGGSLPRAEVFVSPMGDDVNNDGSRERPFQTIFRAGIALQNTLGGRADGGVISLLPGDHVWGTAGRNALGQYIGNLVTSDRWLEVRAADGATRESVVLASTGAGGLKTLRVHINGVTIRTSPGNAVPAGAQPMLWLSNCFMIGSNRLTDTRWTPTSSYPGGMYVTECRISSGRFGVMSATLARNVVAEGLGDDAFTNNQMVVNAEVRDQRIPAGSGFHSDVIQLHASGVPHENVIVYNLRAVDCSSQPWHVGYTGHVKGPDWSNIALVNVLIENELSGLTAQWCVSAEHVLWWHLGINGAPVILRDSPTVGAQPPPITTITHLSMRNCIFERFSASHTGGTPSVSDVSWAQNNHFRDTTTFGAIAVGSSATTGGTPAVMYQNVNSNDFRPVLPTLRNRVTAALTPVDAANRPVVDAIGPLQP